MLSPWLARLDPFWLRLLIIVELALPLYLLLSILWTRFFVSERWGWKRFPTTVPLILAIVPAVAAWHEWALGGGAVFFAVLYLISFILVGMREHILFYDCALPFEFSRQNRWFKPLCALQMFWWLQAPVAAFNGLNWPRGLMWTQATIAALTTVITLGFGLADLRGARRKA